MTENYQITLNLYLNSINARLKQIVSERPLLRERLGEAMEYSLMAGGKRLRAVLMLEFYRMCGKNAYDIIDAACSIELIHAFSLIHDDLPCMDNDDFRRGKPSCHKKFDEATALLAGDALNTLAFEVITNAVMEQKISAVTAVSLISVLSKAIGINGMIGGQIVDLASEGKQISMGQLELLQSLKTGALIEAACVMGTAAAGKYDKIADAAAYAQALGRAFQIVDDILDVTGSFEELGKPIGSDEQSEKSTYVTLLGINGAKREAQKLTQQALDALNAFDDNAFLKELTEAMLNRRN